MTTATAPASDRADIGHPHPLIQAFTGPIEPVRVTPLYQLGLMVVAGAMLILPLIYLTLVGCAVYAVLWHAIENVSILTARGSLHGRLLLYIAPLVMGGLLVLFMIKPLFARSAAPGARLTLDPDREPLLFGFVARICGTVGAPPPRRIDVDCQVNASASFRRGLLSLFGNDLVLTIGLPLVADLDVRQLAGILAHEFGHFAQGTAMRLCFLIRSVNVWFYRVVHERDEWDHRLDAWANAGGWATIIVGLSRAVIWVTRQLLKGLMLIGHGISCFMARQMEFDADRYEARVAGCESFAETSARLRILTLAASGAVADLRNSWKEGRLGDDLPELIVANIEQIPDELKQRLLAERETERTGFFDTHPCDRDRIASARREGTVGVFRASGPAPALFSDFPALCKEATLLHYQDVIGLEVEPRNLVPTAELVREGRDLIQGNDAALRFFQGIAMPTVPILPATLPTSEAGDDALEIITRARAVLASEDGAPVRAAQAYDELDDRFLDRLRGSALAEAKVAFQPAEFQLVSRDADDAHRQLQVGEAELRQARSRLEPFVQAARERVLASLALLRLPEVRSRVGGGEALAGEAERVAQAGAALTAAADELDAVRRTFSTVTQLASQLQEGSNTQRLVESIQGLVPDLAEAVRNLKDALGRTGYPFEHISGGIPIAEWAIPIVPVRDHLGDLLTAAHMALDRCYSLQMRINGRLAVIAEQVERALGFEPLPEPRLERA